MDFPWEQKNISKKKLGLQDGANSTSCVNIGVEEISVWIMDKIK